MRHRIENVWADYCWACDRSRWPEVLALVGGAVVAVATLWLLITVLSYALCGETLYGIPMVAVAVRSRVGR